MQPSAFRADPFQNMAEDIEVQLKKLDEEMKTAKTQADKDAIKKRQDELERKLEESKKK